MNFKKLIETQLSLLKTMGKTRREIEKDLGYSEKYIDQALARGGNEALLNALSNYKTNLEVLEHTVNEDAGKYLNPQEYIRTLKLLIDSKDENIKLLEQRVVELELKVGKAGGRRHSA